MFEFLDVKIFGCSNFWIYIGMVGCSNFWMFEFLHVQISDLGMVICSNFTMFE
jgi:hypothetical protein